MSRNFENTCWWDKHQNNHSINTIPLCRQRKWCNKISKKKKKKKKTLHDSSHFTLIIFLYYRYMTCNILRPEKVWIKKVCVTNLTSSWLKWCHQRSMTYVTSWPLVLLGLYIATMKTYHRGKVNVKTDVLDGTRGSPELLHFSLIEHHNVPIYKV